MFSSIDFRYPQQSLSNLVGRLRIDQTKWSIYNQYEQTQQNHDSWYHVAIDEYLLPVAQPIEEPCIAQMTNSIEQLRYYHIFLPMRLCHSLRYEHQTDRIKPFDSKTTDQQPKSCHDEVDRPNSHRHSYDSC